VLCVIISHALRQLSSQHAQPLLQGGQRGQRLKALAGVDGLDLAAAAGKERAAQVQYDEEVVQCLLDSCMQAG
jgi:hypothetical protein